jgi:hypothetical protein
MVGISRFLYSSFNSFAIDGEVIVHFARWKHSPSREYLLLLHHHFDMLLQILLIAFCVNLGLNINISIVNINLYLGIFVLFFIQFI